MSDKFWLFIVVGKAALITILVWFGLVLGVLRFKIGMMSGKQQMLKAAVVFLLVVLPTGIATWWIFRKLQSHYTRREARAVATAFGAFTPVSLLITIPLAQIPGGYASFLGGPFGLVGAFMGVVVMTAILNFLVCLFTLSMTRRIVKLESTH